MKIRGSVAKTFRMEVSTIMLYLASAVIIIIGIFYVYATYKLSYWRRKGVKSPPANIIFGNMKELILFEKTPGQVLRDIYYSVKSDEPFVGCYLFHKPLLIVRSPELIKQFMIKDHEIFPNRSFGGSSEADPLGYVSLLGIRKPRWKYLRAKLTPCLTAQKLRNMLPLIVECSKKLMQHIESDEAEKDGTKNFELKTTAGRYCTDVFASTAFGVTTNSFDEKNTEFWEAGQRVLIGWKRGMILMIHVFLPELIRFTSLVSKGPAKFFRNIFWHSYETREQVGNKRGDLIDSLMALKNGVQNPDFVFEGDNLVAQSVSFYIAGYEATASAIAFALYDLSRNSVHEARAYEEIVRVCGDDELTMDMLNNMNFLEKCINESLRLNPPLPMQDRVSNRDYRIPGTDITLEKGSTIFVATSGINTDPRFFKNPEIFDPTRTDGDNFGFSGSHFSFGIGPKSCIGQRFGLIITKVALIMILREYALVCKTSAARELSPGTIFTIAVDGIPLQMRKRNK